MATEPYEVEYETGDKRVKLLHREDAETLRDQKGVKGVRKKGTHPAANKSRSASRNKRGQNGDDE